MHDLRGYTIQFVYTTKDYNRPEFASFLCAQSRTAWRIVDVDVDADVHVDADAEADAELWID